MQVVADVSEHVFISYYTRVDPSAVVLCAKRRPTISVADETVTDIDDDDLSKSWSMLESVECAYEVSCFVKFVQPREVPMTMFGVISGPSVREVEVWASTHRPNVNCCKSRSNITS